MFFRVKELELEPVAFDLTLPAGSLDLLPAGVSQPAPLQVSGRAEFKPVLAQIRLHGRLAGSVRCACDRCLEPFPVPVDSAFDLVYEPSGQAPEQAELALSEDDTGVGFYDHGGLELADAVREHLLLLLPMQRLCRESCLGLCPVCGVNRNEQACSCAQSRTEERWAALRDYHPGGHNAK
ncbi:MAG: DUF177 domain-containing protein [Bryobacterales bacterium]|nr:DUF177 domain-containing protein [Bryobacterales bacterium]